MRAAAILGPGNLSKAIANFRRLTGAEWTSLIEQADVAVLFGGDGTVHRHLTELVEVDVPLLVVPCGSGNDFAHSIGIRNARDAAHAWERYVADGSNLRSIDLGVIQELAGEGSFTLPGESRAESGPQPTPNGHYFCCIAGVGIDASIASRANALPKWLRSCGGYALSTTQEIARFTPFPMKVSWDGTAAAFQPTLLVAVANAPTYGGGMKIAPQAKLDDGKLDVCIVRGMNKLKMFCAFPTVYFGRHLGIEQVEYQQTDTVRIETETPFDVYADGEYVCQTPASFSVAKQVLKVMVPG